MPRLLTWAAFALAVSHAGAVEQGPPVLQAFVEGQGPPLVMLGGGTRGADEFAPHATDLATDHRVVRLQTLNVERSRTGEALPAGYSVKQESAAMARSLDRLGIAGPIDLVGHSFGALIALDFALDHPARVRSLVLAEPPAFWAVSPAERGANRELTTMIALTRELTPDADPTDDQLVRFLCALGTCGAKPPARRDDGAADWIARRSALRGLSAVANHTDDVARLKSFRSPVLVVTGTQTVAFHRRIDEILAGTLPRAGQIELPGGHGAVVSARQEFVQALRAFLARSQSRIPNPESRIPNLRFRPV